MGWRPGLEMAAEGIIAKSAIPHAGLGCCEIQGASNRPKRTIVLPGLPCFKLGITSTVLS